MFGHDWQPAQATIVMVHHKRTTGSGMVTINEYVADVQPKSGDGFRATIQEPNLAVDFSPPSTGQTVSVLVKGDKVKFDKDDPQLSRKALKTARDAGFADVAGSAAGTRVDTGSDGGSILDDIQALLASGTVVNLAGGATRAAEDPAARLAKLDALKQRGLMSDTEYAAARQRIIDAI